MGISYRSEQYTIGRGKPRFFLFYRESLKGDSKLQILLNAEKEKLEFFTNATGITFEPLKKPDNPEDKVAVVVQGAAYINDLAESAIMGIPVIAVAGGDNLQGEKCAREATQLGIPDSCIIMKKNDKVYSLDNREITGAIGKGIGIRAIIKAAQYALEKKLCPEPLIWEETVQEDPLFFEEEGDEKSVGMPVINFTKADDLKHNVVALNREKKTEPTSNSSVISSTNIEEQLIGILNMSKRTAVVFRATNDANNKAAYELSEQLKGVHLELSLNPVSYKHYGKTPEIAAETGRYMCCNGNLFTGCGYISAPWLIAEIDESIMTVIPGLTDKIYKKAEKIIHVVGKSHEGKNAVQTWLDGGWKLDAIVPEQSTLNSFRQAFGNIVFPNIAAVATQMG